MDNNHYNYSKHIYILGAFFLLSTFLFSGVASAAIITVDDDGPANFSSIQDAIDAASAGDTIEVAAGTYEEQVTINKANLVIQSTDGAATTIIDVTDEGTANGGIIFNADGVMFDGFTVKDFTDSANENKIIRINSNNNIIQNNIIQGNLNQGVIGHTEYGILFQSTASGNLIDSNEVFDIGFIGVNVAGAAGASNNTISNNNVHDIGKYAITVDRSSDNTVTGNDISDLIGGTLNLFGDEDVVSCGTSCWGMIVWGAGAAGTTIDDQDLIGLPNGISLSSTQDVTVQNSEISDNGFIGIRLGARSWPSDDSHGNVVKNNVISGNGEGIVMVDSGGGDTENNTIENNEIHDNGDGISLSNVGGSSFSTISGNNIHDNNRGIYIEGSYNINLDDNTISTNTDAGAYVTGEGSYDIYFNGNEIDNSEYGIFSEYSEVNVDGDNIHDNTYGIWSQYGGSSLYVTEADIHENDFGIYLINDYLSASENNIHDNMVGVYVGSSSEADLEFNNIVNNTEAGLKTGGDGSSVYAEFNYWGSVFGPTTEDFEAGDAILLGSESDEVDYSPWLTRDFETAQAADTYVGFEREVGGSWDIVSTPVSLEVTDPSQLIPSLQEEGSLALRFNSETQLWEVATSLEPLEAIYIFVSGTPARFPINPSPSVPSRDVGEGWNLWGPAPGDWELRSYIWGGDDENIDPDQAFTDLFNDNGFGPQATFTRWVSPPVGDQLGDSGSCWVTDPERSGFFWDCDDYNAENLYLGQGYWVFMNEDDEMAGSSSTPVSLEWLD